eukprot:TRINITY_DN11697_c0_g1_i1.p1 TRINITY_DN11697_c0_g1~~TRINITY_DN11697_c0_g1_i1.p1  ORF type:complete len:139 (+),score=15.98 TRINITY_DN11697_c0_g1_i1:65-481(+)
MRRLLGVTRKVSWGLVFRGSRRWMSSGQSKITLGVQSNQLPSYEHSENLSGERRKLLYRSRERGMLETDLILGTFALENLASLTEEEATQYSDLIDELDPDIWNWITKRAEVPAKHQNNIMTRLQAHALSNPLGYTSQ